MRRRSSPSKHLSGPKRRRQTPDYLEPAASALKIASTLDMPCWMRTGTGRETKMTRLANVSRVQTPQLEGNNGSCHRPGPSKRLPQHCRSSASASQSRTSVILYDVKVSMTSFMVKISHTDHVICRLFAVARHCIHMSKSGYGDPAMLADAIALAKSFKKAKGSSKGPKNRDYNPSQYQNPPPRRQTHGSGVVSTYQTSPFTSIMLLTS